MRFLCLLFALIAPLPLSALPSGISVVPTGVANLTLSNNAALGSASVVKVDIGGHTQAMRMQTLAGAKNPWDVQAAVKNTTAVKKGDVLLATFYMRGTASLLESSEAETQFVFELGQEPWTKSIDYPVRASKEWRLIHVPFVAAEDLAVGKASVIFRMGYRPQTFEIAGFQLVNFEKKVALKSLPVTKVTYQGREEGAAWRKAAEARIQSLRMAPLRISVVDATGKPVKGAAVSVKQTKNAFLFGSAFSGQYVYKSKPADKAGRERYEREFKRLFNASVEENAFKWSSLAGDWGNNWGMDLALKSARWAKDNGMTFRGHVLLWPSWNNTPKALKSKEKDLVALRAEALGHVRETAVAAKGLADHWDVINEPFDNHDLTDILGPELLTQAFQEARKADPVAKLYINDYAILAGGGGDTAHRQHYEKVIAQLLAAKAPLQGIGMQGHFGWSLTGMDDALKTLDRYAKLLPNISITEYDIAIDDMQLAADYTRDLLTLVYSHPATEAFMLWGFWDGAHWHETAPLYYKNWSPKPALRVWEELVLKQWMTKSAGKTGADGSYELRGHKGDYSVTVKAGQKTKTLQVSLKDAQGAQLEVKLP